MISCALSFVFSACQNGDFDILGHEIGLTTLRKIQIIHTDTFFFFLVWGDIVLNTNGSKITRVRNNQEHIDENKGFKGQGLGKFPSNKSRDKIGLKRNGTY